MTVGGGSVALQAQRESDVTPPCFLAGPPLRRCELRKCRWVMSAALPLYDPSPGHLQTHVSKSLPDVCTQRPRGPGDWSPELKSYPPLPAPRPPLPAAPRAGHQPGARPLTPADRDRWAPPLENLLLFPPHLDCYCLSPGLHDGLSQCYRLPTDFLPVPTPSNLFSSRQLPGDLYNVDV